MLKCCSVDCGLIILATLYEYVYYIVKIWNQINKFNASIRMVLNE